MQLSHSKNHQVQVKPIFLLEEREWVRISCNIFKKSLPVLGKQIL